MNTRDHASIFTFFLLILLLLFYILWKRNWCSNRRLSLDIWKKEVYSKRLCLRFISALIWCDFLHFILEGTRYGISLIRWWGSCGNFLSFHSSEFTQYIIVYRDTHEWQIYYLRSMTLQTSMEDESCILQYVRTLIFLPFLRFTYTSICIKVVYNMHIMVLLL